MSMSVNEQIFRKVLSKKFPLQFAYYPAPASDLIHELGTTNSYNPSADPVHASTLAEKLGLNTFDQLYLDGNLWTIRHTLEGTMQTTIYSGATPEEVICKAILAIYGTEE